MLEYEDSETWQHYREFYEDVITELRSYGRISVFRCCCNTESHLRGNLYVEYETEREAIRACRNLNGRWYAGKQLRCEFANLTSWRSAICGMAQCPKGTACNFLHTFRNPRDEYSIRDITFRHLKRVLQMSNNSKMSKRRWVDLLSTEKFMRIRNVMNSHCCSYNLESLSSTGVSPGGRKLLRITAKKIATGGGPNLLRSNWGLGRRIQTGNPAIALRRNDRGVLAAEDTNKARNPARGARAVCFIRGRPRNIVSRGVAEEATTTRRAHRMVAPRKDARRNPKAQATTRIVTKMRQESVKHDKIQRLRVYILYICRLSDNTHKTLIVCMDLVKLVVPLSFRRKILIYEENFE